MTDYSLLYDESYYGEALHRNHLVERPMDCREILQGYVLPWAKTEQGHAGGVLTGDKAYLTDSGLHRGIGCAYDFDESAVEVLDEDVVFLGT